MVINSILTIFALFYTFTCFYAIFSYFSGVKFNGILYVITSYSFGILVFFRLINLIKIGAKYFYFRGLKIPILSIFKGTGLLKYLRDLSNMTQKELLVWEFTIMSMLFVTLFIIKCFTGINSLKIRNVIYLTIFVLLNQYSYRSSLQTNYISLLCVVIVMYVVSLFANKFLKDLKSASKNNKKKQEKDVDNYAVKRNKEKEED